MDPISQLPSASDLESRAGRVADPALPLKTKHEIACELREMVDSVRDAEASRVFPHMISVLLDILRNGEPSMKKDSIEYQFRRVLIEIVHRIPPSESLRPHANKLVTTMLHILCTDSEDNAVTCVKTIIDIVRCLKVLTDEHVATFIKFFQELMGNVRELVTKYLSESSPQVNPNEPFPSTKSFKVLTEAPIAVVLFTQAYRHIAQSMIAELLPLAVDVVSIESPAQRKTREDSEAMGEFWVGMSPNVTNPQVYADFISAQIKMISFVAYVIKSQSETFRQDNRGDEVAVSCVRLLQDCPSHSSSGRRELMVVLRHLMNTPNRRALVPHVEKLIKEEVLLGPAVGSQEILRPFAYNVIGELVHQLRQELSFTQLTRVIETYAVLIHNPHMLITGQTVCMRMMCPIVEVILTKDSPDAVAGLINVMVQTCAEKMAAIVAMAEDVTERLEKQKRGDTSPDIATIEKERPVASATYASESPEDVMREFRQLYKALLYTFRMLTAGLKRIERPTPDGELMLNFFEMSVRCVSLFDVRDLRDEREVLEWIAMILIDTDPHVFQEIWTRHLDFFFNAVVKRQSLLHITQLLFQTEGTSTALVSIVLRHFSDKLGELGEQTETKAISTIRIFKLAFNAVTGFPEANEPVLAKHLARFIMDSFPMAAKATHPTHYFHLIRALFRAIGSGAGRFELLYKEVLPLLPEMLESLNRQLNAADAQTKDLLVELCLTVPLRLTHLLPHLHYLMQPLVSALQGGPELVSQGLRTLELCIDNLTGDFLDPILKPVLRDLMEALHSHLKPLPGSHHHAHTTIRILGKLGGRNRRLLDEMPHLQFKNYSENVMIGVSFSGRPEHIQIGPMARLAAQTLRKPGSLATNQATYAYQYLEQTLLVLLNENIQGHERESVFVSSIEGLFDAIHVKEIQEQAEKYLRSLSRHIFTLEARRSFSKDNGLRRFPSHMFGLYLDALPHALARPDEKQASQAKEVVASIIHDLVEIGHTNGLKTTDLLPTLHQIAARFSALCFEEAWVRKSAGCAGIMIMASMPEVGERWTHARELDIVRTLLHVLKDVPHDPPRNVSEIMNILTHILRVTHSSQPSPDGPPEATRQQKVPYLIGIFFSELSSVHPVVRQAARTCIELLGELNDRSVYDLLRPHRDRVLTSIYVKPLRALPTPIIIGQIEAIRYCVSLNPPLPELTDELLRLLHEALALADMDDAMLAQRSNVRAATIEAVQLRVACIKLLTASMPLTDFFSKQNQTRPRITGVYFKSLYSSSPEVKDVAHDGLRTVLEHQNRLPKDLLQTGLRPILMNLADPKRLSIAGLEGLARLLKLLTNYFKVEIGSKLLDHFRIIADAEMLKKAARGPLCDNDEITKLVRLVNIFHLLPSAANVFLPELVNVVVHTEAQLHSTSRSPFSEPLGKFLDRYPTESVDLFFRFIHMPRFVRTLRNILQSNLAPLVQRELAARSQDIVDKCFRSANPSLIMPGLLLCSDLVELIPSWTAANGGVTDAILTLWTNVLGHRSDNASSTAESARIHKLMLNILIKTMEESPRIDILFEIVAAYSRPLAVDLTYLTRFLYGHVALNSSVLFRRNILTRFLVWFDDKSYPWSYKTYFLRYIITPMILIHTMRPKDSETLFDRNILARLHDRIWKHLSDNAFKEAGDMFIIELLHLTTIMLHRCPQLLVDAKKEIIRHAWPFITHDDTVVKQTANLLAARFFEAYDSPAKLILTVWTGLLKPPHPEVRTLVKQALDILAPVLQLRMPKEAGHPLWAKTTRRLLAEESHGMSQIQVIYQLIVRQPALFYPCRDLFIPHMVNSLAKLGLQPSATPESRSLSLDVLSLVFSWEQKSISSGEAQTWATPLAFRETMVSYLVRLATGMQDLNARNMLIPRALALLKEFLSTTGWSDVSFKLDFFRKALDQARDLTEFTPQTLGLAIASAKVLNVVCADKPDSWYIANAKVLQKLVQTGMQTDETALQDSLHPILDRLVRLFPLPKEDEEPQGDMAEFHTFVNNAISEGLRSLSALRGTLMMLKSVITVTPERIEPFAATLMKIFNKYAKDHMAALTLPTQPPDTEVAVPWLISIIELCQMTPAFPADQRRLLYSTIQLLAEKSHSMPLCQFLLETAKELALKKKEPYPTMKEKAALLLKMMAFESRPDPLPLQYLEMIYEIYTDTTLRRSDLTARLEPAFLIGCRARDSVLREKFTDLLDSSIQRSLMNRLMFVLSVQSWEPISDGNWIFLALDLILSSIDGEEPWTSAPSVVFTQTASPLAGMVAGSRVRDILKPMRRLLFFNMQTAHETWVSVFSAIWSSLSRKEQVDVSHNLVVLLSKDYLIKQTELRPNVIQALLDGIYACSPPMSLPPHLLKYLAKTFGAWHVTMEHLQDSLSQNRDDDASVRESTNDALAEVYAELSEEDMFYGLWRRRALHSETSIALTYEQIGMWQEAQTAYENAQLKLKNGLISFSESEYCLWEDHWITATEKLQQWDYLYDLARQDGNQDLMLEAAWRNKDWSEKETKEFIEEQLQTQNEVATPRRRVYEAFLALVKLPGAVERNTEFTRILEDAMQLSLRKWVGLPNRMSTAHIQLLQHFQQFVELQEAVQIFGSLSTTTAQNLERKSSDLKLVLQAWRERLPNLHDDISVWSDLVAWRQNVFNAINKQYLPLIQANNQGGQQGSNSSTYGYRGFHETAWIINRFAHVARKHDLLDVAHTSLTRIYQLPNIEISEAFLKLREEARCHLQVPERLHEGLNLINNTNLTYFSNLQKAEFYTLKGMFYSSLGQNEDASQCFGQAVQLDMNLPKAWAEWGRYNDKIHKESNTIENAANAVSCYLQAAGLFKSMKSRPLLTRVLWLLSNDDANYHVGRAFDTYQGDSALWYWITLIPQLILSLTYREAKQARHILLALARLHPQALFFPLRTTKEDLNLIKQRQAVEARTAGNLAAHNNGVTKVEDQGVSALSTDGQHDGQQSPAPHVMKHDWEYVDEIVQILKTAYPLLALTLETMVDQFSTKFKATPEEEIYRFTFMLLQDGLSTYCSRILQLNDDGALTENIVRNIARLLIHLGGPARKDYEDDFIHSKPSLYEYIQRLQHWRGRYEKFLDARPRVQPLDLLSHWLVEFQYTKFDEVEVPGQYLEHVDSNAQFSRIRQFGPKFELCRGQGYCYKRFIIHGHDSTKHAFAVQQPAGRWCKREDRVMQLFRTFSYALTRRKESRKRNLHFHLPVCVSFSPGVRLVSNDASYVSLQDVYDQHCEDTSIMREDPILSVGEKVKAVLRETQTIPTKGEYFNLKKSAIDEVSAKMVPDDVLHRYMVKTMDGPSELWRMRKAFTTQLAAVSFMTYALSITSRWPARFHISRLTGEIYMSELQPGYHNTAPVFASSESVPFRFTPNMQRFVTSIGTEGVLVPGIVSIARALTKPEFELDQHMCLFSRDEVITWLTTKNKPRNPERLMVMSNIDTIVGRAVYMACKGDRNQDVNQSERNVQVMYPVTQLVNNATNTLKLAVMPELYHPWF